MVRTPFQLISTLPGDDEQNGALARHGAVGYRRGLLGLLPCCSARLVVVLVIRVYTVGNVAS